MKSWQRLWGVACVAIAFASAESARADFVADIKSYAAAVDTGDWKAASVAADRLLADPAAAKLVSDAERTQMLELAAGAAESAGETAKAIDLYRRLVAQIEAREGGKSYSLAAPLRKLGDLLAAAGQLDEAAAVYDRAAALSEAELGSDNTALLPIYQARRDIDRKRLAAAGSDAALKRRLEDQDTAIATLEAVVAARQAAGNTEAKRTRAAGSDAPFQLVPVHYGTNRLPTGLSDPAEFYGDKRGPLELGVATVSVPKAREIGEVPVPSMWRSDFRPNAALHFILTKVEPAASVGAFTASAAEQIGKSRLREALVFIHGYNSDFEKSVFRAAQLAVDLDIDGAAFMYSWPSKGSLPGYVADGAQVIRPLTRSLKEFLAIVQNTGAERIHVVAHSMGNRFLLDALDLIARDVAPADRKPMFRQVVFAAPDVDAEDFTDRVTTIGWMANRMTLYASSKDRALQLSSIVNGGYRRAGDAEALVTVPGLDTIDTTEVGGEGLGHGDFAERALDDFRAVVWLSLEPKSRCVLTERKNPSGVDYWQLTADQIRTCPQEAFRTAISLIRGRGAKDAVRYVQDKIEAARKANDAAGEARYAALLPIFESLK